MFHSNNDKGGKKKPQSSSPETADTDRRSGRVAFDARGNPIWEWQLETGVYSRDVTTQKLKKLDLGGLSIADTGIYPQPRGLGPTQQSGNPDGSPGGGFNPHDTGDRPGSGFNPYDSSNRPGANSSPYDRARALSNRLNSEAAPAERRRTPADLRKLDQFIKQQRKKLEE
jgi:hypothetical protein